jgi:CRISPR-associated protein Csx17
MPEPISITGCRSNVFGHALKALGILRALNACGAAEHLDRKAEAWWDVDRGVYVLRSAKYPFENDLASFFERHYRPTPIFSPWNTGGGLADKQDAVVTFTKLDRKRKGADKPAKPDEQDVKRLIRFLFVNRRCLGTAGLQVRERIRKTTERAPTSGEFRFTLKDPGAITRLKHTDEITVRVEQKITGEKAVLALVDKALADDMPLQFALRLGREFFPQFQAVKTAQERRELFSLYRDELNEGTTAALDAVFSAQTFGVANNPAFLDRGKAGNSEIFRSFWSNFLDFRSSPRSQIEAALYGGAGSQLENTEAPGAPFFPDQVKTYNNGLGWVVSAFPFCALDYILAVEGALALRGSVARLLGSRHGNFAAFPFVFETADDMTDDQGDVKGTALSLWLPIWNRPATFAELESFILDSQARLPGREARFTAEFERAIRVQGVDAGFAGYQEFRFKMKGARVPWVCTGRYLAAGGTHTMTGAAELLRPLDGAGFLDQFQIEGKDGRTHRHLLAGILDAIEDATSEREPHRHLTVLEQVFEVTRRLAVSKRFREVVKSPTFPPPLQPEPWLEALGGLETEPEFEIARAVASIIGHEGQQDGTWSAAEPLLGSILPLKLGRNAWYLPESPSAQAVWSGADLSLDLARALARRYQDSRDDDRPALASACSARLSTVLRFLYGELDDARIARYTEALSLIGWRFGTAEVAAYSPHHDEAQRPIPLPYAAIRSLLEAELHPSNGMERRRCISVRALALLGEQSSAGVAAATVEALDRLRVVGVPNPYANRIESHKTSLAGRDIVRLGRGELLVPEVLFRRVAAAVCIPLHWRDRFTLLRTITLPQAIQLEENA